MRFPGVKVGPTQQPGIGERLTGRLKPVDAMMSHLVGPGTGRVRVSHPVAEATKAEQVRQCNVWQTPANPQSSPTCLEVSRVFEPEHSPEMPIRVGQRSGRRSLTRLVYISYSSLHSLVTFTHTRIIYHLHDHQNSFHE